MDPLVDPARTVWGRCPRREQRPLPGIPPDSGDTASRSRTAPRCPLVPRGGNREPCRGRDDGWAVAANLQGLGDGGGGGGAGGEKGGGSRQRRRWRACLSTTRTPSAP